MHNARHYDAFVHFSPPRQPPTGIILKRLLLKQLNVVVCVISQKLTSSRSHSAVITHQIQQHIETLSLAHTTSMPPSSLDSFKTG